MKNTRPLSPVNQTDLRFVLGAMLAVAVVVAFVLCLHTF